MTTECNVVARPLSAHNKQIHNSNCLAYRIAIAVPHIAPFASHTASLSQSHTQLCFTITGPTHSSVCLILSGPIQLPWLPVLSSPCRRHTLQMKPQRKRQQHIANGQSTTTSTGFDLARQLWSMLNCFQTACNAATDLHKCELRCWTKALCSHAC